MKNFTGILAFIGVISLTAMSASATVIVEVETNGPGTNNSIATAQVIDGAFTSPSPAGVSVPGVTATIQGRGGFDDVDFFSFQNFFAGSLLYLDIDNTPATFDTLVAVFDASGTLVGYGDDTNPADAGSDSNIDAFMGPLVLNQLGTYYIAVTEFPNYPSAALLATEIALGLGGKSVSGATPGLSTFDFNGPQTVDSLEYTLQATVATPEPATFGLVGGALLIVGALARRRKA